MRRKNKWLPIAIIALACLIPVLVFAGDAAPEHVSNVGGTIWSLLPPVVAIALALITKEVYSSLFIGIVVGGLLYSNFNLEMTINTMFFNENGGMVTKLSNGWNVGILIFLVVLGMLVSLMNKAGGSEAFGRWASSRIKSRVGAQLSTMVLGMLIFVDDYFNCLTVGSVMRPVTDRHNVSRAKLAYLIDATAAPICIIAPISSWAAAVTSSVPEEYDVNGFNVFLQAIPYNFYALLSIIMIIYITTRKFDYGPMKLHEANAIKGDLYTTPDRPYGELKKDEVSDRGKVLDLVLPVVVLIATCILGMVYTGGFFTGTGFVEAFANSDASVGLVLGSVITIIFTFIYYMIRRVMSFKDFMECLPKGFQAMVPAILILTFAWTLSGMTGLLGGAEYVEGLVKGAAPGLQALLPAVIFLVACFLAFATGTSWGTFGILIPIVVPLFVETDPTMLVITISACLGGAVMGDHCSPISDTTIMASAGAQSNHVNHVSTQAPYALTVAGVAFVSYILAGFIKSVYISLPIAIILMLGTLFVIEKMTKNRPVATKAKPEK